MTQGVFCILVEGELHSPELAPLTQMITQIFYKNQIDELPKVIAVPGCSKFNTVAGAYYREYPAAHKAFPICAIADRDYRVNIDSSKGDVKNEKPSLFFLPRHEWENYLFDDLEWFANYLSNIPLGNTKKACRSEKVDSDLLHQFMSDYFSDETNIRTEFFECLKFVLSNRGIRQRQSIGECPARIEDWKTWYENKIVDGDCVKQKDVPAFDAVCAAFSWKTLLENPSSYLDEKKKLFRGKEAFNALWDFSVKTFGIRHYDKVQLQTDILKKWADDSSTSPLYRDLESILLQHFEKQRDNT